MSGQPGYEAPRASSASVDMNAMNSNCPTVANAELGIPPRTRPRRNSLSRAPRRTNASVRTIPATPTLPGTSCDGTETKRRRGVMTNEGCGRGAPVSASTIELSRPTASASRQFRLLGRTQFWRPGLSQLRPFRQCRRSCSWRLHPGDGGPSCPATTCRTLDR